MSRYLVDHSRHIPNINVVIPYEVRSLIGYSDLETMRITHMHTGEDRLIPVAALFVFIGTSALTACQRDTLLLDEQGFTQTSPSMTDASR